MTVIRKSGGETFQVTDKNATYWDKQPFLVQYCEHVKFTEWNVNKFLLYSPSNSLTEAIFARVINFTDYIGPQCESIHGEFYQRDVNGTKEKSDKEDTDEKEGIEDGMKQSEDPGIMSKAAK